MMINDVGKTIIITPPIFLGMVKHNTYKIGVDWGMVNMLINQRNHDQPLELGVTHMFNQIPKNEPYEKGNLIRLNGSI